MSDSGASDRRVGARRAVLFDLDDTLFDHQHGTRAGLSTLRSHHACLRQWDDRELAARHSVLLERLHLDVLAGRLTVDDARVRRFTLLFADAGETLAPREASDVAEQYRVAYVSAWRLVPGALPLLEALSPRARIGIVTNNIASEQVRKIEILGLRPLLDAVVISEEEGVAKPDPRIFAIAVARLGCDASGAVMVGDAWATDVAGALGAGLAAVWFNPQRRPAPDGRAVPQLASLEPAEDAARLILAARPVVP